MARHGDEDGGGSVGDLIRPTIVTAARQAGFDVDDVTVRLTGGHRLVRVVVDREGGVGLDAAAALSRDLSAALDADCDEVIGDRAYTLEVTSRGVGAPLVLPRHFERSAGRRVTVVTADGGVATVRLVGVVGDRILVLDSDTDQAPRAVPIGEIRSARTEVEFTAPAEELLAGWRRMADQWRTAAGHEDALSAGATMIEGDGAA